MNIHFFMNKAIEVAKKGVLANEIPIGAVLVNNQNNEIISIAHNKINQLSNSTKHAEMVVIEDSCLKLKSKFLSNTTIFVTLEPCAMCAAAISEVRINTIYFGAYDDKKGSLESIMKIYNTKNYFVPEIYGGIKEIECSKLIKNFFKEKRDI